MNYYCLECAGVWFALGGPSDSCADCGSQHIASERELSLAFVTEHLLPPLVDIKLDEDATFKLAAALAPCLHLQDMIMNGPFDTLSRE